MSTSSAVVSEGRYRSRVDLIAHDDPCVRRARVTDKVDEATVMRRSPLSLECVVNALPLAR
jgi:hypothetical protein